jgi:hypothetical protein
MTWIHNMYVKRSSMSLTTSKMQIIIRMWYHLIPYKGNRYKDWQGCREQGILVYCWRECKFVWPIWKKIESRASRWPSNSLFHVYTEQRKWNQYLKRHTCIQMFIAALFTITKTWRNPKCPSKDEWVNSGVYTSTIYYSIYIYILYN